MYLNKSMNIGLKIKHKFNLFQKELVTVLNSKESMYFGNVEEMRTVEFYPPPTN